MFNEIKPALDWLYMHPRFAGIATFLVTFTESLAIIGLFIPGTVIMVAIGSLIGAGYIPLVGTILWAVLGAIVGDALSFWFGHHFHVRVRTMWPLRSYPVLLQKGISFFKKHGGKSIFISRFAGPVRPVVPLVAGMMSMSPGRFLLADIPSAFIWAPVFLLPGILLGAASQTLPKELATQVILFVVVVLLVLWSVSWLLKKISIWLVKISDQAVTALWRSMQNNVRWLYKLLCDPTQPNNPAQLSLLVVMIVASLVFIVLAFSVYHYGVFTDFNQSIYHFMRSVRNNLADRFFVALTLLSSRVLIPMWLAVCVWLVWNKKWRAAVHYLLIGFLIIFSTDLVKHLIHIERPTGLVKTPEGWSFPSGHSSVSLALFGFLAVLLTREQSLEKRWFAFSIAAFFAGLIMLSRLYLTAHWLTDVVGGALLAIICLSFVTISYRRRATPKVNPKGVLIVAFVSLLLSWSWVGYNKFHHQLNDYTPAWEVKTIEANKWWAESLPPLYRTNHFGKPIQILNVQWVGSIDHIEKYLTQQGWVKLTKSSLLRAIDGLTNKKNKHSYYLEQLYQDRKTALEIEKVVPLSQGSTIITLRLWDSHLVLDNGQTLWVGTIGYRKPWHIRFLKTSPPNNIPQLPAVTDVLVKDLPTLQWKRIANKNLQLPSEELNINWDGNILLVK